MSYREVSVIEIRVSGTDRKTVRRYVDRARACGLDRDGDVCQLTDELLAAVIAGVRPSRPNGKSQAWETIAAQHDQIKAWLTRGLTLTKVHTLLGRRGVVVSYRTLHRYATTELEFGQRQTTVRVADGEPGAELQVDFGRLGMLTDAEDGHRRVVQGLIFTAVYSRHTFVWPTYRQTHQLAAWHCQSRVSWFSAARFAPAGSTPQNWTAQPPRRGRPRSRYIGGIDLPALWPAPGQYRIQVAKFLPARTEQRRWGVEVLTDHHRRVGVLKRSQRLQPA
jgi:hypothetical protein